MTQRIAISLPDELYRQMERVRKQRRVPRSRIVQEAVDDYVRRQDATDGQAPEFIAIERAAIEDLRKALRRARLAQRSA